MSDALDTAKLVLGEVARAKHFTETKQIGEIFLSSETIVSALAYLTGPMLDAEHVYRLKRQSYIADGMTAAAAEANAKASEEYIYWRKLEMAYELGQEQINILKKFGPLLENEYRRS